jgi:O-antigen ligase
MNRTTPAVTPPRWPLGLRAWGALWALVACAAVALPWLTPWSSGPTPNALPWLVSMAGGLVAVGAYRAWAAMATGDALGSAPHYLFVAWLCAALLSSLVGLIQYFGLSASLSPWVNFSRAGEAFGNLRQRNQFASLTAVGLVAVLYWAGQTTLTSLFARKPWLRALLLWGAITLLAMANAASASRTGALHWLVVAALAGIWSSKYRRDGLVWACGALLAYGAAVVLMPTLLHAATGFTNPGLLGRLEEPSGCESRRVLWANVVELIAQKPITGWGWGELKFSHFSHPYVGERFCAILDNAHNLPLHLAVELGVPLATAAFAGLGWLVWRGKPWAETDSARQAAWAVLTIIGLHSLVEYPLWYGPFQVAVGLCIWLLCRQRSAQRLTTPRPGGAGSVVLNLALVLGLAALAYAAWDYTRVSQLYRVPAQRLEVFRADTLEKARASKLFVQEVQFAELTTTPLDPASAARLHVLAKHLLHFSPEPTVLKLLLDSAAVLDLDDDNLRHIEAQFRQAYPQEYARWQARRAAVRRLRAGDGP